MRQNYDDEEDFTVPGFCVFGFSFPVFLQTGGNPSELRPGGDGEEEQDKESITNL